MKYQVYCVCLLLAVVWGKSFPYQGSIFLMLSFTYFLSHLSYIFQSEYGDEESQKKVEKLLPEKVKKRRKIQTEDGVGLLNIDYLVSKTMESCSWAYSLSLYMY